jgi:hypothetical protein
MSHAMLRHLRRLAPAGALAVVLVALLATPALAQAADPTLSGVIDRQAYMNYSLMPSSPVYPPMD